MTHKDELLSKSMSYNKDIAFAWGIIIERIHALRGEGKNLQEIGTMLGVGHGTVSRWLRGERGGERTSFADMVKYTRALNMNPVELFESESSRPSQISKFDQLVGKQLAESIELSDNTEQQIATKTGISLKRIMALTEGKEPATPEELFLICKASEAGATSVLNKVAKEVAKTTIESEQTQKSA